MDKNIIIIEWWVEDVWSQRPDLSLEEAQNVLYHCERNYDANFGITWSTLEFWSDELYPLPKEGEIYKGKKIHLLCCNESEVDSSIGEVELNYNTVIAAYPDDKESKEDLFDLEILYQGEWIRVANIDFE